MPSVLDLNAGIPQRSSSQLAESITELTGRLNELKRRKRQFNASINEQIRELEEQIEGEQTQWQEMKRKENT